LFFDRPESGECAILVHLNFNAESQREDPQEFEELVLSAGGDPVEYVFGQRIAPHPRYFVGTGKLEEISALVKAHEAEIVIFNHSLSPSQERNLEEALCCRVLDRTGLILDIFAQRARTHEGKLQVELAQMHHMSTRLVRGWTHLERQKGGIGMRGPGETQLETDRRLLRVRIKSIVARLGKVQRQREQGRRSRKRAEIPTISLVGYTNAGKSSLFNSITDASVFAADQLFATLDPTLRRVEVADIGSIVLADTVGFIRHLPHRLIEAFRATLEEACSSALLLHIIDAADEDRANNIEQVHEVLAEIGAEQLPRLEVYNKIDLLDRESGIDYSSEGKPERVWLSAHTGDGVELIEQAVAELLRVDMVNHRLELKPEQGCNPEGVLELEIRLPKSDWQRLLKAENFDLAGLMV
jgi:GTP-binding protein HflX